MLNTKVEALQINNQITMEQSVNERFVKLSGRVPFPDAISLGDDITVTVKGRSYLANCVKVEELDLQDGTKDVVYVLKTTLE